MHDYEFPPEWPSMSDSERSDWMTADRCRRQALRQSTAFAERQPRAQDRHDRRVGAAPSTVSLDDNR